MRSHLSLCAVLFGLAALLALGGCKRTPAPINGIGGFELDETQLGALSGRCLPASEEPLMVCPGVASVALGEQNANIDLYFGGPETDARLREILLDVSNCAGDALEAYLSERMGEPHGRAGKRIFWSSEHSYVSAGLPIEGRRCEINFVSVGDEARIARLGGTPGIE